MEIPEVPEIQVRPEMQDQRLLLRRTIFREALLEMAAPQVLVETTPAPARKALTLSVFVGGRHVVCIMSLLITLVLAETPEAVKALV